MLAFEPVAHRYTWNGVHVPSVTQVLAPLFDFSMVPQRVLHRKQQIGTAVHTAIHLELTGGGVDLQSIDPACLPYFDAWRRFRDECLFEPVLVEFRVWNNVLDKFMYAGTLDEWGLLQGYPAIVDWKTTMVLNAPAVGSQTAAYLTALVRMGFGSLHDRRFALRLGSDGRYKLEQYRHIHEDWFRFTQHLRQWYAREEVAC